MAQVFLKSDAYAGPIVEAALSATAICFDGFRRDRIRVVGP